MCACACRCVNNNADSGYHMMFLMMNSLQVTLLKETLTVDGHWSRATHTLLVVGFWSASRNLPGLQQVEQTVVSLPTPVTIFIPVFIDTM
jgi:hypothetical protein